MNKALSYLYRFIELIVQFARVSKINTIFFFPYYHIGGAEKVHLEIVKSLPKKKSLVFITSFSLNENLRIEFKEHCYLFELPPYLLENRYYNRIFKWWIRGLGLYNRTITVFGCNSSVFYDIVPILPSNIVKIDLIHAFSYPDLGGMEIYSIPVVHLLDCRIVISSKTFYDFQNLYLEHKINSKYLEKIKIIENGVKICLKPRVERTTKLRVAYFGRLSHEKRVTIIAKIGIAIQEFADLKIYGSKGDEYNSLIEQFYEGEISDPLELDKLYLDTDILLIASEREGFPMVIMEGMTSGVVCICTDVGGISEHIKHAFNGFLVDNDKDQNKIIQDFKKIIEHLNNDRHKLDLVSSQSREYAINHFDINTFRKKYLMLLNNNKNFGKQP